MKNKIILYILTITMLIGYFLCLWSGVTENIKWLQSLNYSIRYHGYEWKIIGTICYLFFFLGVFLINRTLIEKLISSKIKILCVIPIILLWIIEIIRLFNN